MELATLPIPEVGICFDGLLLRAVQATKSSASHYRGFDSPSCEPLARLGVRIQLSEHIRSPSGPFECLPEFNPSVIALQLTPGLEPHTLESLLSTPDVKGFVLGAFGSGTIPSAELALGPVIGRAVKRGLEVLVITPSTGVVDFSAYKNGLPLIEAGAINGGGMNLEAAATKFMHGLAICEDSTSLKAYLERDVVGEH